MSDNHATKYYCGWIVKDYREKYAITHSLKTFTLLYIEEITVTTIKHCIKWTK